MKNIEPLFTDFYNKNQGNRYIKNRTDIEKLLNSWSITDISAAEKQWRREIQKESILLGLDRFGGCFIFSETHFFYKSTGLSDKYTFEPLENFLKINVVVNDITFHDTAIGNISKHKNEIFLLIEQIKSKVIIPYIESKDDFKEAVELEAPRDDLDQLDDVMSYLKTKIEDFNKISPDILSYDEVINLSKKKFSLSPYSISGNFVKLFNSDNYLTAFKFGIVVTTQNILFKPTGKSEIIKIEFSDINKIKVDLSALKIYYAEYTILAHSCDLSGFDSFKNIFTKNVIERLKEFQEIKAQKLIEEQTKRREEEQNVINEETARKIKLMESIRIGVYNQDKDVDSFKYYFDSLKGEIKISEPSEILAIRRKNHFNLHGGGESDFFNLLGLYFTERKIIYIYFESLSEPKHTICQYHSGLDQIKYFLNNEYPKGSGKDHSSVIASIKIIHEFIENCIDVRIKKKKDLEQMLEAERVNKLNNRRTAIITELDRDSNGEVDLIDAEDFNKLLTANQKYIIQIDRTYIQKFVKISIYLKTKRTNIQKLFKNISKSKDDDELTLMTKLLKNQIHFYDLLVFHSINMITSLMESDLITFYEIYECFDQFRIFNSNWENEVSQKLTDINQSMSDLMYSIYHMENKIVKSINNLTYATKESFNQLRISVDRQLNNIDSSIKFNNLISTIQAYEMYKI